MKLAFLSSREATTKVLAIAATAVVSCLIAIQAYSFWNVLQTSDAPIALSARPAQKPDQNAPDIGRLAATHLFGDVEYQAPQYSEVKEDKTLNLTLRGIVANSGGNTSLAIIQSSPNNEETFALGDNVFNKGKLDFVAVDHVILARSNGQLTRLQLPEQESSGLISEEYLPTAQPEPEYIEPMASEPEIVVPEAEPLTASPPDTETMAETPVAEPELAAEPEPEPAIENQEMPEPAP